MDLLNPAISASTEDLGQLHGLGGTACSTNNDSGFATRHTVVIEVVEGLEFVGGGDRRYYVKLGLENTQWRTTQSLKSRNPAWREYFIGDFIGTKLESPSIVIKVKYRRTRAHLFGTCRIPLLSVSGTDAQDRWYDLHQTKLTAGQPKLRLRITCRKSYDKKSEVEVEVQLINSIIGQEREVITRNTEKIAELTRDRERKGKSKHKVQKLLREITHANKKIRTLQAKKQLLLDKAKQRKILLSQSEANFCVPARQSRSELNERLLTVRAKLRREQEAFEFHKRYSGEVDGDEQEDWAQNTEELKRRLAYLKHREKTYLVLLQETIRQERERGKGGDSDEEDGEWLELALDTQQPGGDSHGVHHTNGSTKPTMSPSTPTGVTKVKVSRQRKSNADAKPMNDSMPADRGKRRRSFAAAGGEDLADHPFPGVRFHPEWESFSELRGAKKEHLAHLHDNDDGYYEDDGDPT